MRGGHKPQAEGKAFESTFETVCQVKGLKAIKVPEAGRWIGRGAFKPIPGLCDFIIIKDGLAAFVDTKTTADGVFKASAINKDQLEHLIGVGDQCPAGYVVYFRQFDKVIFFSWKVLMLTAANTSLKPDRGILLGGLMNFDPKQIFSCYEKDFVSLIR